MLAELILLLLKCGFNYFHHFYGLVYWLFFILHSVGFWHCANSMISIPVHMVVRACDFKIFAKSEFQKTLWFKQNYSRGEEMHSPQAI